MKVRAIALPFAGALALVVVHCGGAAAPEPAASNATTSRASSGGEGAAPMAAGDATTVSTQSSSRRERAPTNPRATTTVVSGAAAGSVNGTAIEDEPSAQDVPYWQGRLDQALSSLSGGSECRDVCRASGDICLAAHEICGLTGDNESASPQDPRCGRARGACEQATRQRNSSCPVCPTNN